MQQEHDDKYLPLAVGIGVALGTAFGAAFGNIGVGIAFGIPLALAVWFATRGMKFDKGGK